MNPTLVISSGIASTGARIANHLLTQQPWAAQRLAAHAGMQIELRSPPLPPARFSILPSGHLAAAPATEEADAALLVVSINPLAVPLVLARSPQSLQHVQLTGPDELAATVRELMLKLEWDFEEDLSRVVGDVAAHRVVKAGVDARAWQRDASERLARNFSEYWTEESPLLARRLDAEAFARELDGLVTDIERIEARLAILEGAVKPSR